MLHACAISPFAGANEDCSWVLWERKTNVSMLQPREQTDTRSVYEDGDIVTPKSIQEVPEISPAQPIQRKQYNAILSRMDQAKRKTTSFSTWQS